MSEAQHIDDLIVGVKKYLKVDEERLKKAYDFAEAAHAGQTRMSGETYISHPLGVALLLTEFKADEDTLIVALLHDVAEDTTRTVREIKEAFGSVVGKMVDSLTKLPKVHGISGKQESYEFDYRIESIRKIFEIMQQDVRVTVIKLCDRLHNMQSLSYFRAEKQKRIAQETFDIYVKIADRLCMLEMKEKLEVLSYRHLFPEAYQKIQEEREGHNQILTQYTKYIHEKVSLCRHLPKAKDIVISQFIHFGQAIEQKLDRPKIETRVTIIMETEEDCYLALRDIHSQWKNLRDQVRDYIHLPKSNGFQGLKTTIIKRDGATVRMTIQTQKMYDYGRQGVATSCFLKSEEARKVKLPWMTQLKTIHKGTKESSREYMTALEHDIFKGSMTVFTEDNRNLFLPFQSTALDAAFFNLGQKAKNVMTVLIDGKPAKLSDPLQEDVRIQFTTGEKIMITHRWLQFTRTTLAKSYIYEYLKSLSSERRHAIGEEMIQQQLNAIGFGYVSEISMKKKQEVASKVNKKSWTEVVHALAEGNIQPNFVTTLLLSEERNSERKYTANILIKSHEGIDILGKIFDSLKKEKIIFQYLSSKNYNDFSIHRFQVQWTTIQKNRIYSQLSEILHVNLLELKPFQKGILPYLCFLAIPLFRSINTFLSRYVMLQGLSPANATMLHFLSSGTILFLIAIFIKLKYREQYAPLKPSLFFFFCTVLLIAYTYLLHLSLFYTSSINYVIPVCISFAFIGISHAFCSPLLQKKNVLMFLGVLSLWTFSLLAYLQQPLEKADYIGLVLAIAVMILHILYTRFGNSYQQHYKVKNRGILLLCSMFFLASLLFVPFVSIQNIMETPLRVVFMTIINGMLTGGIAQFFFFELTKFHQHYKLTYAMSLVILMTLLITYFLGDSINLFMIISTIFMTLSILLTGWYEYKKQGLLDPHRGLI